MTKKIKITKNGPYHVSGSIPLTIEEIVTDEKGMALTWKKRKALPTKESYMLCRCGQTKTPPFCDGSHLKVKFDGTETASRKKYLDEAETYPGPELDLTDVISLCAHAEFCLRAGDTWNLTEQSDDPKNKALAIQQAGDCPSGRLIEWKKSGKAIEPDFEPSISLTEIPKKKVSGPIWAKGQIPIESSDGIKYEVRNRVTLCRCGMSLNKPFCDGSHIAARFRDRL